MATIKKTTPKAQSGKKVDDNTVSQKSKFDKKYDKTYKAAQKNFTDYSNKNK